MHCIYNLKGKTFDSEAELDDFLLERYNKYHSKYGDLVFSKMTNQQLGQHELIDKLDKKASAIKEKNIVYMEEGEEVKEYEAPHIGVTAMLASVEVNGSPLFPIFRQETYWANRISFWTNDNIGQRNVQEEFDAALKKGVFTKAEIELIFDGDISKARFLTKDEANKWRDIISKKWKTQGSLGTDWHKAMELLFSEDAPNSSADDKKYIFERLSATPGTIEYDQQKKEVAIHLRSNGITPDKVSDQVLNRTIDFSVILVKKIKELLGDENLQFYPEVNISSELAQSVNGAQYAVGTIDLLVVDSNGKSHVFDYKTSTKGYGDYDTTKKLAFAYQLASYMRILKKNGVMVSDTKNAYIIPIQLVNFQLTNKDDVIQNGAEPQFSYDDIFFDENRIFEDQSNIIKSSDPINGNLENWLPIPEAPLSFDTSSIISNTQKQMETWAPTSARKKRFDEQQLYDDMDAEGAFKKNDEGNYEYTIQGLDKKFIANDPDKLYEKVKEWQLKNSTSVQRKAKTIADIIKEASENDRTDIAEQLSDLWIKSSEGNANPDWFQSYLAKYCNGNWEVITNDAMLEFGMIAFRNKLNKKQIDFVKISNRTLNYLHYYEDNNKVKNNKRSNLTYAFESDVVEDSKSDSLMLKATNGNIELEEALVVINQMKDLFGEGFEEAAIGNIEIMSTATGRGLSAKNDELVYCWKKLVEHSALQNDVKDNISDGTIKFASESQKAINDIQDAFTSPEENNHGFSIYNLKNYFKSALSDLDTACKDNDVDKKIKALTNIAKKLAEKDESLKEFVSDNKNRINKRSLYNEILLGIAELRGIKFRQQQEDHSKYLQYKGFSMISKGLSGTYIDNPGNLDSQTLNVLTNLVTEAYQNIRTDMVSKTNKVRKLVEELKKDKGFSPLLERTVGNSTNLYKNMIEYKDGDIYLKDPDDPKSGLSTAEKNFLRYFLQEINNNRFPGEDIKSKDLKFFRLPLAKGDFQSQVSSMGLMSAVKKKLQTFNPKKALEEMREQLEGVWEPDKEVSDSLFEMNNIFDSGESKDRADIIIKKGEKYFETNLETLLLKHEFAYTAKDKIDEIMPMIRAAMTYLAVTGSEQQNRAFKEDLKYSEDYIKAIIKNQPIDKNLEESETRAFVNKLKGAASFVALAFSPVQGMYQILQGFWQDISLYWRKPDGTEAFSFKNFAKAFKIVFADALPWRGNPENPSKVQLLNELYGINDMDMNTYTERIRTGQHGIFNFENFAYKFTSRPDYYNRMTIIVAKMLEDGSWDAIDIKDGKLEYNWKKDKRYYHLANNIHGEDYDREKALLYANAKQFQLEHAMSKDGVTPFEINGDELPDLPGAYTTLEMESMKSLCDLIYGYYSHEKKSLIHYTMWGSMFMQMRTYWSGKKNQYLAPGGVRVRGNWEYVKNKEGQPMYYQVENGNIQYDKEFTTENTGAPVVQWKGQWQEGIIVTAADIMRNIYNKDGIMGIINPISWYGATKEKLDEEDENLRLIYRSNMKQFMYDIIAFAVIGGLISGIMLNPWVKDLEKEAKEADTFSAALAATAARIAFLSIRNSASDLNFFDSIGGPAIQWTPFSVETGVRMFKNITNVAMGDRTFYGGVINTFAAGKQMRPLFEYLGPFKSSNND